MNSYYHKVKDQFYYVSLHENSDYDEQTKTNWKNVPDTKNVLWLRKVTEVEKPVAESLYSFIEHLKDIKKNSGENSTIDLESSIEPSGEAYTELYVIGYIKETDEQYNERMEKVSAQRKVNYENRMRDAIIPLARLDLPGYEDRC
jgi:hypothetical protein|tara:strand:+ start:1361 stop:1795 length:435 start_codon:yes stop_codon:yes gene_type:complete